MRLLGATKLRSCLKADGQGLERWLSIEMVVFFQRTVLTCYQVGWFTTTCNPALEGPKDVCAHTQTQTQKGGDL